ncbi:MAG: hypothetical protein K2G89_06720 [Lachnospiraceae bacterium]|nr:hypothetical protein [Lachnospiraceae bacterium]
MYKTLFFKNKIRSILSVSLLLLLLSVEAVSLWRWLSIGWEPYSMLGVPVSCVYYIFLFFLFISFDFSYSLFHGETEELLQTVPGGMKNIYKHIIRFMTVCVAGITALQALLTAVFLTISGNTAADFFWYGMLYILIFTFLSSFAAVCYGSLAAKLRAYWKGCFLLLVPTVLNMTFFLDEIISNISGHQQLLSSGIRLNLRPVFEFFMVCPEDIKCYTPTAYMWSLSPVLLARLCFWCLFLYGLGCRGKRRSKGAVGRPGRIVYTLLCLALLILSRLPYSDYQNDDNPWGSWSEKHTYYGNDAFGGIAKNQPADFSATGYDIWLRLDTMLDAEVTLHLSQSVTKPFFTLNHNYTVSKICDWNGNSLDFIQEGDYISVQSDAALDTLTFYYKGIDPAFYTNLQGIFLPGYLCYYPQPGYLLLGQKRNIYPDIYSRFLEHDADFTVDITYHGGKIITNLDAAGSHTWKGTANGCTIISGMVETHSIEGVQVVCSSHDYAYYGETALPELVRDMKAIGLPEDGSLYLITLGNEIGRFHTDGKQVFGDFASSDMKSYYQRYLETGSDVIQTDYDGTETDE